MPITRLCLTSAVWKWGADCHVWSNMPPCFSLNSSVNGVALMEHEFSMSRCKNLLFFYLFLRVSACCSSWARACWSSQWACRGASNVTNQGAAHHQSPTPPPKTSATRVEFAALFSRDYLLVVFLLSLLLTLCAFWWVFGSFICLSSETCPNDDKQALETFLIKISSFQENALKRCAPWCRYVTFVLLVSVV